MDNDIKSDNFSMTEFNSSEIELPSIVEQNFKTFVPKIRIRLRPNSDQINDNNYTNVYGTLAHQSECEKDNNEYINQNSDSKCYKILEDSGGGGSGDVLNKDNEARHSYMLHGINLRTRQPKQLNICKKMKTNEIRIDDNKRITNQTENDFVTKTTIKSLCTKNPYKSYILNSSKSHHKKEKNNRRPISKVRNEILENFNLKDIVNHENFLKLSSEIQWQLANLLPDCDKPKVSDFQSDCHCSDTSLYSNQYHKITPNVHYTALNNEFLGKALNKYSMKMGQCDLINLVTSERENLRSRPNPLFNDENILVDLFEKEIKSEEVNFNNEEDDSCKVLDDLKSNSSVCTTETMEMNGTGNIFESVAIKSKQCTNIEDKFVEKDDFNCLVGTSSNNCNDVNEEFSQNNKDSVDDSQCQKSNLLEKNIDVLDQETLPFVNKNVSTDLNSDLKAKFKNLTQNLCIDTNSICHELDSSDLFDDNIRKRGRKRKCFNFSDDILMVPVKRSNRSTAGKRPARLDSESPPTSPSLILNSDRKNIHNKLKKQKERNRNIRKCKSKNGNSSDELDNIIKNETNSKKHFLTRDISDNSKNYHSSPESLPNESNLSPLSKFSPNGSSLLNSFCRSNFVSLYNDKKVSTHVNSVQGLSPSWSCTSESTTPSVKSDYGHIQPTKTSPTLNNSTLSHIETKVATEQETKSIHGMPPPRQTLTLAAMREKMRAKKLAKEDNRKDDSSNNKRLPPSNNPKNKRQNNESISLLKEGDDDFQLMDKMMSSSEEFDELLNNSQDSLLEFFMGDDNYDFEANVDPCSNTCSSYPKPFNSKKSVSNHKSFSDDIFIKDNVPLNCVNTHYKEDNIVISETITNHPSTLLVNKNSPVSSCNESMQSGKSIVDTIATVLQKFNSSKENGLVINNCAAKTSVPSAYLVDGNGLSTALSIIQSLNPGAKVTTQQFYLVNSGPQLILQPSPPTNIVSEKPSTLHFQNKVSLAPKIANQPSIVRQASILSNPLSSTANDGFSTMSLNQLSFASNVIDKPLNITSEPLCQLRSSGLKMSIGESKNTYMMSPITHNVPHVNHLQTISTPHPIGLVHSVQPSMPSLFSSQLRFVHPSQAQPNTISLIAPNIPSVNTTPMVNNNQSPKLLFLCPTVPNNTVTTSNVLNQDQKYLLLSKQPDKQATIQLVSSQGLWQQLNPTMISQSNNLLVMQPQPINNFDSLLCSNVHNIGRNVPSDVVTLSERSRVLDHNQQQHQFIETSSTSSLIIDSRSLISKLTSPPMSHNDIIPTSCSSSSANLAAQASNITTSGIVFNLDHPLTNHSQDVSQS